MCSAPVLPVLDVPVLRTRDPEMPLVPAYGVMIANAPLVESVLNPDFNVQAPPAPSGLFVYVPPLKKAILPPAKDPLTNEVLSAID